MEFRSHSSYKTLKFYSMESRKKLIIYISLTILVAILAFVIGYVSKKSTSECVKKRQTSTGRETNFEKEKVHAEIINSMQTENLRENLRYFSKRPHVASSQRTFEISQEIFDRFQAYGFKPEFHEYNTLLSFPLANQSNYVYVVNQNGSIIHQSRKSEEIFEKGEEDVTSLPPFLAYGPNGTAKGQLFYVNYGRQEDFEQAVKKFSISFEDSIVLVKYGKIGRGEKVANAAKYGAIGILIYADPQDYAPVPANKFPNGRWLSDDGVERGSIISLGPKGDPLTGGYPAKDGYYHESIKDFKGLPTIPAQPIAAVDARILLSLLGGSVVPEEWKGTLNVTYKIGPFEDKTLMAKLVVNNQLQMKNIRNVCGTILGDVEPGNAQYEQQTSRKSDRYVILGNHIDSWVFGAVDASSGTTVMMEMARALGGKLKTGWKPRRTIKLCGWDGEEFNLIGSVEYVEEFYNELRDRAVAYINLDSAVAGNYSVQAKGSPLLHELLFKVHKQIPDPYIENTSVFQKCQQAYEDKENPNVYKVYSLTTAGSDHFGFYQFLGVSSIDLGYRQQDLYKAYNVTYYPQYHTLHDTVYWMENFVDKEYKIHLTTAKVAMGYLLQLADAYVLPFNGTRYIKGMRKGVNVLIKAIEKQGGDLAYLNTELLKSATSNLSTALDVLGEECKTIDTNNDMKLRVLNDKLIQIEKGLTYPTGLPNNPQQKNYITYYSTGAVDFDFPFPAIAKILSDVNQTQAWSEMKKQISITAYLIQGVSKSLTSIS